MSVNLAIVEDNKEMLQAMSAYFKTCEQLSLVKTALSVEAFLSADDFPHPDVVLLDLVLPGMSGTEGIPLIKQSFPGTNILVHTVLEDSTSVFTALKCGASGYITKETTLESTKNAIINAHNGMSVMSQEIASKVLNYFKQSGDLRETLSKKELNIAESLKMGMSYKMIAFEYKVSIDTIRFHVRNIYRKLEINSKGELINLMMRK
jgi:DNA-binding NarL/FixJ family response regulator